MASAWTQGKIEELKALFDSNLSASVIGARMGITRNAVLGKLHRLGIRNPGFTRSRFSAEELDARRQRRNAARRVQQRIKRNTERELKPMLKAPPFIGALDIPYNELRRWSGNVANQCRFIASDVVTADTPACGNETLPGESWCGHCKDIVFRRETVVRLAPDLQAAAA